MLTFQQIISRLTAFWEKRGCLIHQGYDLEVGAGTFNPATFLRCLGPEPYKTAYVEPSRRPADGRFGENPNRLQFFHQYQVIIKPSPADIQESCLKSFEAIGLNIKEHDIRFVHDDWEGPTLGAWGLGWEVWCDGMEVCQFTYFQAMASLPLKPVSVEITYGIERLAMYIQNVNSIFDVHWNDELTFKDIAHQSEVEWSAYSFNEAKTEMWQRHFDDFEKEAKDLVARHHPLPAYDFVIKASHAFNILQSRGVISVTERTGYIARIRDLARLIAVEYLAERERRGFPLLAKSEPKALKPAKKVGGKFNPELKRDFLLEIGSEQLPATFVPIGMNNLEKKIRAFFNEKGLGFEEIRLFGTPRRIALFAKGVAEGTAKKSVEKKGPALASAFDATGAMTPQGAGFLKSCGLEPLSLEQLRSKKVKGLEIRSVSGVDYLFVTLVQKGVSTFSLLAEALPNLILSVDFPKKMRWGDLDISYPRPIHWIVALFGKQIIPFQLGAVASGRSTFGHAQLKPAKINLALPENYLGALKEGYVLADVEERKQSILTQIAALEKQLDGKIIEQNRVMPQVLHLTEWPQLTSATFDASYLRLLPEVLSSEMVEHQRYFPVCGQDGKMKNLFVITADNTPNDLIRQGNQKVLSARLADGAFLDEQDRKIPLESFNEKLKVMTFQKDLGSMLEKVMRLASHAEVLNDALAMADQKKLARAALLCKADLASAMVGEFPDLQGVIGKEYALSQNENKEVAEAISEHWMPKAEGAPLPATAVGTLLSLADKIDNLLGYYSVGLKPTSSHDPYALRRQTLGLLRILIEGEKSLDLKALLLTCSRAFPKMAQPAQIVEEILAFVTARAKTIFEDFGFKKDEIEASFQGMCSDPFDQFCKVKALHQFRQGSALFSKLFEVYKRAKGQLEMRSDAPFDPSLAHEPAEKALVQKLDLLHREWTGVLAEKNYAKAFSLMAELQPPLAKLFDDVKILADDPQIRQNRLALLQKVFSYFQTLLDFSKLQEG
jgi:glycyl-tRNA synthetase